VFAFIVCTGTLKTRVRFFSLDVSSEDLNKRSDEDDDGGGGGGGGGDDDALSGRRQSKRAGDQELAEEGPEGQARPRGGPVLLRHPLLQRPLPAVHVLPVPSVPPLLPGVQEEGAKVSRPLGTVPGKIDSSG